MISTLSLVMMIISVLLALILPVVLIIYLWIKTKYDLIALAFGGVGFYFAQVMVKMSVLGNVSKADWFIAMSKYPILMGIFLAFLAGVVAEVTRILVFMLLFKKEDRSYKNGIGYGIGYGGVESIMMVGLAYLSYVGYSIAINNGYFASQIGIQFSAVEALRIQNDLLQPAYTYLLGGLERAAFLVIQIALSLAIMYCVAERKPVYFGYAILAHLVINVPIILLGQLHQLLGTVWLLAASVVAYKFIQKAKNELFKKPEKSIPL